MSQPPEWSAPDADPAGGRPAGEPGAGPHAAPPNAGGWGGQQPPQPPQPPQQGWGGPQPPQPAWGQPQYGARPGWGQQGWAPQQPPRPGIIPLRPIGLGEIYDGAFRAIRTNPRTMIGFSAVVIAVAALIATVPQAAALVSIGGSDLFDPARAEQLDPGDLAASFGGLLTSLLVPALVQALATTVVTGLLIVAVSNAVLGRRTGPAELWARTRGRVPALIGLALLLLVLSLGLALLVVLPGVLLLVAGATVVGILLTVLGGILAVLAYVALGYGFWALAAPALLLENLSVIDSLRRSWRLVRPTFWRVLGIMLLTTLLVGVLSGIISVPFSIVSALVGVTQDTPYSNFGITLLQLGIAQIGSILAGAVLYPLSAAVTALLYIDLRMRQEGLDVELMRAAESPQR